jgi:hypothetical protein
MAGAEDDRRQVRCESSLRLRAFGYRALRSTAEPPVGAEGRMGIDALGIKAYNECHIDCRKGVLV